MKDEFLKEDYYMKVNDLIKILEPYKDFDLEPRLKLEVAEDVLDKREYKFPTDYFDVKIQIDDIGYSDKVVLLGIKPY